MNVEGILAEKGRQVVTVTPDKTLADVVQTLSEHRIGAVLVLDERETILGIVTERDVVRALAANGAAALGEAVSRRMTVELVTCTPKSDVNDIMGMMTRGKFRHVPVVVGDRLAGVVSIGDVVKHRLAEIETEHKALRDYIATA